MARLSPVQRKLNKLRKAKGLRKSQSLSFNPEGHIQHNTEILDINYGAWSFIDMQYAPDFKPKREKHFDFI